MRLLLVTSLAAGYRGVQILKRGLKMPSKFSLSLDGFCSNLRQMVFSKMERFFGGPAEGSNPMVTGDKSAVDHL
jgi:hypothetical protein